MGIQHGSVPRLAGMTLFALCQLAAIGSSQTLDVPPQPLLAYTRSYFHCSQMGCDAYGSPNASEVLTPYASTGGTADSSPTWSPDATRIAFARGDDIAVMDAVGGMPINLTNTTALETSPAWSPDGGRIAFVSDRDGPAGIYLMNADGSGVVRVPIQVGVAMGRPAWSPDGRLAFACIVDAGNTDICVTRPDGSGFVRLTSDPGDDIMPAWGGPAGEKIAFATSRFGYELVVAVMNADGSGFSTLCGYGGWNPAWSPNGQWIAFISNAFYDWQGLYLMKADGTGVTLITDYAESPAWLPSKLDANFSIHCEALACSFDASPSLGSLAGYTWDFGDQTGGSGAAAAHTFADGGDRSITLTITDVSGQTATDSRTIYLNRIPLAAFTSSCTDLTCTFDWLASTDPDGSVASVSWDFGDGTNAWQSAGGSPVTFHTYPAFDSYTAIITVIDNYGGRSTATATVNVTEPPPMHIGDIDSLEPSTKSPTSVAASLTVHGANEQPLSNVHVTVIWSDQTIRSCMTDQSGKCPFSKTGLKPTAKVTLTVFGAKRSDFPYEPAANHDPDGDSDGTSIVLSPR